MKNPKWREAYPQGHKVKYGGKFLTTWSGYSLDLIQTNGGTISANKNRGYEDDEVNFSYTANQDYYFNGWSANEGSFNGNTYKFGTNDATAKANFAYTSPLRTIHTNSNTQASNATRMGSYKGTGGSVYDIGTDYIVTGTPSAHGYSAEYLGNIEAIHFKFKPVPITLEGSKYLFGMTTIGEAAECSWYDGTTLHGWTANQNESIGKLYFYTADTPSILPNNNRDGINGKKLATMSSNRFPIFSFSHAKTTYVNSTYAENINGTIYAKCDDWTTGENDIKLMMRVSAGASNNHNEDRTCFVSAYYNNNFVGSAWQGLYNILYRKFYAYFGLFSATTSSYSSSTASHGGTITNYYDLYLPVAGSSQFDMANFSDINNAYQWLMAQN